jgi:hypothetical protein
LGAAGAAEIRGDLAGGGDRIAEAAKAAVGALEHAGVAALTGRHGFDAVTGCPQAGRVACQAFVAHGNGAGRKRTCGAFRQNLDDNFHGRFLPPASVASVCFFRTSFVERSPLAEHEIDTQIPKVADLELGLQFDIEAGGLISKQELDEKAPEPRAFIGMIQLLRISSKIYTEIYRVDRYVQTSAIRHLLEELKTFEETIQPSTSWDRDWLLMHCKDAVRRLIEPFLLRIEVYDDLLNEAMHAAGQMCQLFKKLHVHNAMGASFLMCNSVFIAGLTLW